MKTTFFPIQRLSLDIALMVIISRPVVHQFPLSAHFWTIGLRSSCYHFLPKRTHWYLQHIMPLFPLGTPQYGQVASDPFWHVSITCVHSKQTCFFNYRRCSKQPNMSTYGLIGPVMRHPSHSYMAAVAVMGLELFVLSDVSECNKSRTTNSRKLVHKIWKKILHLKSQRPISFSLLQVALYIKTVLYKRFYSV